jgi:predicted RNase H-like HicB family nuclease
VLVYLAVIHRIPGREYRIQFPDFPGVEAHTVDFDEVRDEAKRTLLEEIGKRGVLQQSLPRPTSKEDLQLELTYREGLLLPFEVNESRVPQLPAPRRVRAAAPSRRRRASG